MESITSNEFNKVWVLFHSVMFWSHDCSSSSSSSSSSPHHIHACHLTGSCLFWPMGALLESCVFVQFFTFLSCSTGVFSVFWRELFSEEGMKKKKKTSAVIRLVVKGWVCFTDCHWHWSSVKYQRSRFHYCSGLDLVWNAQHVVRLQTRESKYDLNVLRFLNKSWSRFSFYMNSCCRSKSRDVRRWYVMSADS